MLVYFAILYLLGVSAQAADNPRPQGAFRDYCSHLFSQFGPIGSMTNAQFEELGSHTLHPKQLELEIVRPGVVKERDFTHTPLFQWDDEAKPKDGPIVHSARNFLTAIGAIHTDVASGLNSLTNGVKEKNLAQMREVIEGAYQRSYTKEEIDRVLAVERQLNWGRRIVVQSNEINPVNAKTRGRPMAYVRLYDASPIYDQIPRAVTWTSYMYWLPVLEDSRLPLEIAHPGLKILAPRKLELGRFAKLKEVESNYPLMAWMGKILSGIYPKELQNSTYLFITAKDPQIQLYRDPRFYGLNFRTPPLERMPIPLEVVDPNSEEKVYEITLKEFIDRFASKEIGFYANDRPWLKKLKEENPQTRGPATQAP